MVRKILLFFVISLLAVQMTSAIDTNIQVKTMPLHEVQVTVIDTSSNILERFLEISDVYGDVNFVYSSNRDSFNLITCVKRYEEKILPVTKLMNNYPTGEDIYLELITSGFEIIETPVPVNESEVLEENTTLENETKVLDTNNTSNASSEKSKLTLFATEEGKGILSLNTLYYAIGAIVLLIIVFILIKVRKAKGRLFKKKNETQGKTEEKTEEKTEDKKEDLKKIKELTKEKKEKIESNLDIIEDAEEKIQEAQTEIKKVKKDEMIKKLKKDIIDDEEELKKIESDKD